MEYSPKEADRGAIVSIISYIMLSTIKIAISYITASSALKADGLNNLTDIGASAAVLIGLRISRKPRDHDHPYGHSRAEQISSLLASFIMMSVGVDVIIEAVRSTMHREQAAPDMLAGWTALFGAIVMYGVYRYNKRLARRTNSMALEAAAKDNLSDMFVSIGTVIGVAAAQYGFPILDPFAALAVGIIICKTAWGIFAEATHLLTDGIDPDKLRQYKNTIASISGVHEIIDIKARMYGRDTYVDIVIEVDARMDVVESHRIADEIEERLQIECGISHSHIHVEPASLT